MGSVRRLAGKKGSWYIDYTDHAGRRTRRAVPGTKAEAEAILREIEVRERRKAVEKLPWSDPKAIGRQSPRGRRPRAAKGDEASSLKTAS